jgi:hypothetical protein
MRSSLDDRAILLRHPARKTTGGAQPSTIHRSGVSMLHDLSRQLRRLMKDAARSNFGQRPSLRLLSERNVIRLKNVSDAASFRAPCGPNRLLITRGARMHATSVERGDGCAIAILDHSGVVHAWHDSLPGATAFDFRILGAHVSQFYLPQDVALLRPNRDLITACLHGSNSQQGWHRRPDGSIFWGVTVIEPIHLESGELYGYSHVTRFAQDPRGRALPEVRAVPRQYSTFQGAIAAA